MLSWSALETGRPVNLTGIVDPAIDPQVPGGAGLVSLGRAIATTIPDRAPLDAVATAIGLSAAIDAAAVAANFQVMNRVVDATGLPIGRHRREESAELIAALGLDRFPHADH